MKNVISRWGKVLPRVVPPAWGLAAMGILVTLQVACTPASQVPEFPEYAPAKPFLERQRRVTERAKAVQYRQEMEIRLNIIKGRTKFYRAWAPIYARVRAASPKPNPQPSR